MKKLLLALLLSTGLYASQENNQSPQLNLDGLHQNSNGDSDDSDELIIDHDFNETSNDDIFNRNFNPEFLNGDEDLDYLILQEEYLEDDSLINTPESLPFNHQDSLSIHMQNHSDDTMHRNDTHLINDKKNPINIHKPTIPTKDLNLIKKLTKYESESEYSEDGSESEYSEDGSDFKNKRKKTTNTRSNATLPRKVPSSRNQKSTTNPINHTTAALTKTNTTQPNIKEKPFKCTEEGCNYSTAYKMNLTRHTLIHTGEKPHQCPRCDKCFAKNSALTEHIRTHTGEKPYQCTQCDQRFAYNSSFITHIRTHTGDKPFKCSQCDYSSTTSSHLKRHMIAIHKNGLLSINSKTNKEKTNTERKQHQCTHEGCYYSTTEKMNLNRHIQTHTGDKPFKCSQCDYSTAQKINLITHIRIHTGEKPYQCTQCDKSFSNQSSLKTHIKIHTGEKPHQCRQCNYSANTSSNLKKHIKAIHDK